MGLGADFQIFEIAHRRRIAAATAWRECKGRATNRMWGSRQQACSRWHPRLIEAAVALQREPARRRRAAAEAASQGRSVRRPRDPHAGRAGGADRAHAGCRESASPRGRARADLTAARANLALVLGRMGRPAEALELLDDVFAPSPTMSATGTSRPRRSAGSAISTRRSSSIEDVLEQAPNQPRVWLSYGHMLKTVGRQAEGIAAYRKAIELKPTLGEAWWSLANLKTVRFDEADIAAMRAALGRSGSQRRGPASSRFRARQGDARRRADRRGVRPLCGRQCAAPASYHPFNARRDHAAWSTAASRRSPTEVLARPGGCDAPDPIFIVGMPRAGSTLVEQILSSHSLVEGTSELPDMPAHRARERQLSASMRSR